MYTRTRTLESPSYNVPRTTAAYIPEPGTWYGTGQERKLLLRYVGRYVQQGKMRAGKGEEPSVPY